MDMLSLRKKERKKERGSIDIYMKKERKKEAPLGKKERKKKGPFIST